MLRYSVVTDSEVLSISINITSNLWKSTFLFMIYYSHVTWQEAGEGP